MNLHTYMREHGLSAFEMAEKFKKQANTLAHTLLRVKHILEDSGNSAEFVLNIELMQRIIDSSLKAYEEQK